MNIQEDNLKSKPSDDQLPHGPQEVAVNSLKHIDKFHYKKVGSIKKEALSTIFPMMNAEPVKT